jgi:hypothetical protein
MSKDYVRVTLLEMNGAMKHSLGESTALMECEALHGWLGRTRFDGNGNPTARASVSPLNVIISRFLRQFVLAGADYGSVLSKEKASEELATLLRELLAVY